MDRVSQETRAKRVERWKFTGLTAGQFVRGRHQYELAIWWRWRVGAGADENGRAVELRPRRSC
jgi:hypothetical protein